MISLTNLTCILPETQPLLELFLAGGGRILRLVWASLASGTDGARRPDGMSAEWKLRQTHLAALLLLAELSAYSQVGLFLQQQDAVRRCFPTMDRRTSYYFFFSRLQIACDVEALWATAASGVGQAETE